MTYSKFCEMWTQIHEESCTNTTIAGDKCNLPREPGSVYCPWCRSELAFLDQNDDYAELDAIASISSVVRSRSPVQTEQCPMPDTLHGGFMESDEQLRKRLK